MKKRLLLIGLAALSFLIFLFTPVSSSAESLSFTQLKSTQLASSSYPSYITYRREFHRSSGFPKTKYYRHSRYGQSYSGYLSLVKYSGKDYAIYEGRLYLENSNRPIPAKFEPVVQTVK